ncbi:MAG: hypothetical protein RLZZ127_1052 [Planctomycetota bacterium]|jgi:protoheme IX farnesyltransferase
MIPSVRDLLALAKIRITVVAVFTGYTAIAVHGEHATDWAFIAPCLVALVLLGAAANTLNQLFERDIDAIMSRTRTRRPIPAGRVSPAQAVGVAATAFAGCTAIMLGVYGSWLAAALCAFTLAYYSFFYTLYLKRRHWSNIVIGGVPGAMGPPIAWAAVANGMDWAPIAMFILIFLWTPPHVWALAIRLKDDYAKAGVPMLPVVKGVDETTRQIFIYTVVTVVGSLLLPWGIEVVEDGKAYLLLAVVLGAVFVAWTWILWRRRPVMPTMPLFRFSIIYISLLFVGLIIDGLRGRAA